MIPEKTIAQVTNAIQYRELVSMAAELVSINSVWDPGAGTSEQAAAEWAARWGRSQGFQVELDEVEPGRPNAILTWQAGRGERVLMFEGHTDVVTPGDLSVWRFDPFGARIEGRRMYGRGTNDTKGNLAAMLLAMAALKRCAVPLAGSLLAGVLCDEEGDMIGVRDFIRRGRANRVSAAVICEPQDGLICTTQKGAIRASFLLQGRMGHGAMPLNGLSTAPAIARLIEELHRLELQAIAEAGSHPHLGWPSLTPTVIQAPSSGPPQLNVLPGEAQVLVDVRTVPGQSHSVIREALKRLAEETSEHVRGHYEALDQRLGVDRERGVQVQVEFLSDRPCTVTDENEPIVASAAWATRELTRREPEFGGVLGATDGTFLWALGKIPIVTMGAGERHLAHQADEWVDLDQLLETARIYALTALHYLWPGGTAVKRRAQR